MSNRAKNIISALLTIVIFIGMYLGFARLFREPSGYAKNNDFYDYSEDYDVLITGSSHSLMGILPVEMWRSQGIHAYSLANYGQSLGMDYWMLRNALDYCNPKLVVIDVYTLFFDEKYSYFHVPYVRQQVDSMPWSKTKVEMFMDMFIDENTMTMVNPYSSDHSRWEIINSNDSEASTMQFGADVNQYLGIDVDVFYRDRLCATMQPYDLLPITDVYPEENISYDYLRRMIELCQSKGIQVLLVTCPLQAEEDRQQHINNVYAIADTYNVNFLNGLRDSNINYYTDFYDTGHLNSCGAYKWSDYIASYIVDNYDIEFEANQIDAYYDECSISCANMLFDRFRDNPNGYGCIVLANNPYFEATAVIRSEDVLEDLKTGFLLENLGGYVVDSNNISDLTIIVTNIITGETVYRNLDIDFDSDGKTIWNCV